MIGWGAQHRAKASGLPRSDDVPSSVGGCADPDANGQPCTRGVCFDGACCES
jgi:hypothetical protein